MLTALWIGGGIWYYSGDPRVVSVVLVVHSVGALWGFLTPPGRPK